MLPRGSALEEECFQCGVRILRCVSLLDERQFVQGLSYQFSYSLSRDIGDLERGERLYADKVISLEQLQDLRTQTALTEAALNSARFNWSYATIVAPHDGTVLRRLAEARELVQAGAPILVLGAQDEGFVVRTGLADREIVQVKLGDEAQVRLDALPGETLRGKVTEVSGAADANSGMFGIEVSLDTVDLPLKSGLVAKLTLIPSTAKVGERIYVPIGAIVEGPGGSVFFKLTGPAKTIAAQQKPFEQLLASIQPDK